MEEFIKGKVYTHEDYIKLSIKEMKRSKSEHNDRTDPLVGTVLVAPDGSYFDKAHRGELRKGDHAEFTLIERKHVGIDLTGFTLYTTLEPCVKRNPPKKGCAFRTINARISKVIVGHIDPDPTVAGNGIKILRDKNIIVEFYNREFEKQIAESNNVFFEEAIERSRNFEIEEIVSAIDPIENSMLDYQLDDLSEEAKRELFDRMGHKYKYNSDAFMSYLNKMKLIKIDLESKVANPTGLGLLLLGKHPEIPFPQSRIKFTINRQGNDPIIKDFQSPLVLLPDRIEEYLEVIFPKGFSRSSFTRDEHTDLSFTAVLEVIMNAIVHRDYTIEGSRIMVNIYDDKIVVSSPGIPLVPLEILNSFQAPSFSRNPKIAHIFFEMGFVEERGFGMDELAKLNSEYGLPKPEYQINDNILSICIYRNLIKEPGSTNLQPKGLAELKDKSPISSSQYVESTGVSERSARNHLNNLVKSGHAKKVGKGPSTRFVFTGKND